MTHDSHIILVRPRFAANVGAVARVMRNFGMDQLVLVNPEADKNDSRALRMATHSVEILEQAAVVGTLSEAVAECGLVAGTSSRTGGLFRKQAVGPPEKIMPLFVEAMAERPVALVFGPEDNGLSNEEIAQCHYLIQIPTEPVHPSLNLAQAVAICLYELHKNCQSSTSSPESPEPGASIAQQEIMFAKLQSALEAIHFLYGPKADSLMFALRHLIGRARPTEMEVDILFGLARQIQWFCDQTSSQKPPTS